MEPAPIAAGAGVAMPDMSGVVTLLVLAVLCAAAFLVAPTLEERLVRGAWPEVRELGDLAPRRPEGPVPAWVRLGRYGADPACPAVPAPVLTAELAPVALAPVTVAPVGEQAGTPEPAAEPRTARRAQQPGVPQAA